MSNFIPKLDQRLRRNSPQTRMNITVSIDLKARMDVWRRKVNWSTVASKAFEDFLIVIQEEQSHD